MIIIEGIPTAHHADYQPTGCYCQAVRQCGYQSGVVRLMFFLYRNISLATLYRLVARCVL